MPSTFLIYIERERLFGSTSLCMPSFLFKHILPFCWHCMTLYALVWWWNSDTTARRKTKLVVGRTRRLAMARDDITQWRLRQKTAVEGEVSAFNLSPDAQNQSQIWRECHHAKERRCVETVSTVDFSKEVSFMAFAKQPPVVPTKLAAKQGVAHSCPSRKPSSLCRRTSPTQKTPKFGDLGDVDRSNLRLPKVQNLQCTLEAWTTAARRCNQANCNSDSGERFKRFAKAAKFDKVIKLLNHAKSKYVWK